MNYRLAIVTLFVRDIATARDFYVDKLGFEVVENASSDDFITLSTAGPGLIGLQAISGGNQRESKDLPDTTAELGVTGAPGSVEVGFEVDDVDAVYRDWQAKGVNLTSEPSDLSFGRGFDARDPEGHRLSVFKFAEY